MHEYDRLAGRCGRIKITLIGAWALLLIAIVIRPDARGTIVGSMKIIASLVGAVASIELISATVPLLIAIRLTAGRVLERLQKQLEQQRSQTGRVFFNFFQVRLAALHLLIFSFPFRPRIIIGLGVFLLFSGCFVDRFHTLSLSTQNANHRCQRMCPASKGTAKLLKCGITRAV